MRRHHLLAVVFLTSCSFAAVRGPGSVGPAKCTRGYWYPAGDVFILAPTTFVAAFATAYGCIHSHSVGCDIVPSALALGSLAALASGIYGTLTVSACRGTEEPKPPPPPPPHEPDATCLQQRAELQRAALAEPDIDKRTEMLRALPSC